MTNQLYAYLINMYPHWITTKEIANDLGWSEGKVRYHLGKIVGENKYRVQRLAGTWQYRLYEKPEGE